MNKRLTPLLGATMVLLTGLAFVAGPAGAAQARARKVLVLSLPRMTWQALNETASPTLEGLLARSAVGSTSPRTIGASTSLGEGYATIGAGNRATLPVRSEFLIPATSPVIDAGLALGINEPYGGEPAGEVFERRAAVGLGGATVVHLGMAPLVRANGELLYGSVPGALGSSLRAAGLSAAVVGNADLGGVGGGFRLRQRELALALVDTTGRVGGTVSSHLLRESEAAPFGTEIDPDATFQAFHEAWAQHDVVLLEASDLERADAFRTVAGTTGAEIAWERAVTEFDGLLARVLASVDLDEDLVITVSPAPPRGTQQLLLGAMAGPGVEPGALRSATTRRDRFLTLSDIAPTVLAALGLEPPPEMTGAQMSASDGGMPRVTADVLVEDNERSLYRDRVAGAASASFIVFQLLVYALATIAFTRRRWLLPWAGTLSLMVLAFPAVAFLSGLTPFHLVAPALYLALLFLGAAALAAVSRILGRFDPQGPPLVLLALTVATLLVDVLAGGDLQLNTPFGYSPIVAGRFAGFGNLASALLAVSAILLVAAVWGVAARRASPDGRPRRALAGGAVLLLVCLVVTGHPALGSDVGGVLTDLPAFAAVLLLLGGVRIGWRRAAVIGVATAVVLIAFALIDLARPVEVQGHLARLVSRTFDGGVDGLGVTIERKLAANVRILISSVWTFAIPITLAFLAVLAWRPQGFLLRVLDRMPGTRAALTGTVVAGALGFAVNDSGVAIPAMMLGVLLPYLAWLVGRTETPGVADPAGAAVEPPRGVTMEA